MPETPTKEAPDQEAQAPAQDPERERLEAAADAANRRASEAEQRAAYAAGVAESARNQPRESGPKMADPLESFSQNDLTMTPDEKRRALASAIGLRLEAAQQKNRAEMEQRLAMERASMESRFALDMVVSQRPELSDPKNTPNFAASMTKAKYEADASGVTLSAAQLAQRAAVIYDQLFKPQGAPRPPFIEGAGRPDLQAPIQNQDQFTPQSALEKTYGMKKGTIRPMVDPHDTDAVTALNAEYIRAKNVPLFKRGVQSNLDAVLALSTEE